MNEKISSSLTPDNQVNNNLPLSDDYIIAGVTASPVVTSPGTTVVLTAVVQTSDGLPVSGMNVIWELVSGQLYITLSGNASVTDAAGSATIQATADSPSGGIVRARAGTITSDCSIHFSDPLLGAPVVVNAETDHQLDAYEISLGVTVYVPEPAAYFKPLPGELIVFYWDGLASKTYVIQDPPVFPLSIDATAALPASCFYNGHYELFYDYIEQSQNIHSSLPFTVEIVGCPPPATLPAPVFPDADSTNTISYASVVANNGTALEVVYPGMAEGDTLTATWFGFKDSPDTPIPGTQWTDTRTVTTGEVVAQKAVFHIPESNILPVGNGQGEGQYHVTDLQGKTALSLPGDVNISGELAMNCSTGAPVFIPAVPVRPVNSINLTGPASAAVELTILAPTSACFYPDGQDTQLITLDDTGYGVAQIYDFSAESVQIQASLISKPGVTANVSMRFLDWLPGRGDLLSYGVSTGSRADGRSVCSVYLQTTYSSTATVARLTLTGNTHAIITQSNATTAVNDVKDSHACAFDITDTVPETVAFTLSLPEIPGSDISGSLVFI
ncbi:Ig-like domain-containing protein [Enterobacter sp. 22452]|uniref:Ig-like domain-containing protein n=1 Tax=Enterobacter TaxID=547 RepID=UPI003F859BF2